MKKIFNLLCITVFMIALVGCEQKTVEGPDLDDDLPTEDNIDLTKLAYYEYLNEHNPVITITVKDYGVMVAQLFPEVAQNTVNNFIDYIESGQYDGSRFHRIIETFMIQGGMVNQTKQPIRGQFASNGFNNPLRHTKGVLSMARTGNPNSATSQFFVMHQVSVHLDGAYASFGALISGFNVLDSIAGVATNSADAPLNTVVIESMTIALNGYEPAPVVYFSA